jgi:hypothetical protein
MFTELLKDVRQSGKAARASARRKPPDAATKNESPPVKRHRGEPGHTRDTRAHKQVGSRSDAPYDRVTGAGDSSPRTTDSTPTPSPKASASPYSSPKPQVRSQPHS